MLVPVSQDIGRQLSTGLIVSTASQRIMAAVEVTLYVQYLLFCLFLKHLIGALVPAIIIRRAVIIPIASLSTSAKPIVAAAKQTTHAYTLGRIQVHVPAILDITHRMVIIWNVWR